MFVGPPALSPNDAPHSPKSASSMFEMVALKLFDLLSVQSYVRRAFGKAMSSVILWQLCLPAKCCNNAKCYKLQHFALNVESYKN